jgi:hypothetical protein
MPSRKEKPKGTSKTGEILQTLAVGLIEYSADKYLKRKQSSGESSRTKSSRRSESGRDDPTTERKPVSRHGSSASSGGRERSAIAGQVIFGIGAFFVRQYLHHRRAQKEKAKEGPRSRETRRGGPRRKGDAELRDGLDALSSEARRTSESLRHLASRRRSHPHCEVSSALNQNADRLQRSLSNLETTVNNIRNLNDDRLGRRNQDVGRGIEPEPYQDRERSMRRGDTARARDRGTSRRVYYEPQRPRRFERVYPRSRSR